MLLKQIFSREAKLRGQSFKNIKFPRGNYQTDIVPRQKHYIVFIVHHLSFFRTLVQKSIRIQLN